MKFTRSVLLVGFASALTVALSVARAAEMPTADTVTDAKDHPLLSRFAGSQLVGYQVKEFEEVELPAGKKARDTNAFEKTHKLEGKFTRIIYCFPEQRSSLEVMRNYQAALQKAGFATLFSCDKAACGQDFGSLMLERAQSGGFQGKGSTDYWASPFNYGRHEPRYVLASGKRSDNSTAYAAIYVAPPTDGQLGGVYLEIVEPKAMETDKVSANLNADDMANAIAAEGKIALYGIYFDTDKADIKPESKPMLVEMAKLLRTDPKLNVYIVGHTDNQGALAHNTDLSQRRAEAVVKALTAEHKIDAKRLAAKGLASLAPVASNESDAGRAKNRRVELVKQ